MRRKGKSLSVSEEGRGGGSELVSDLSLYPDPWKILRIRIRQNGADPLDPNPDSHHCSENQAIFFKENGRSYPDFKENPKRSRNIISDNLN